MRAQRRRLRRDSKCANARRVVILLKYMNGAMLQRGFLAFVMCLGILVLAAAEHAPAQISDAHAVRGTLMLPESLKLPADTSVKLRPTAGLQRTTFPRPDGRFEFPAVPKGTYYVDIDAVGLLFPSIKVQISDDGISARLPEMPGAPELPYPLRIGALAQLGHFEKRHSFDIMAFIKTPYGIMIAFMVFTMVLMPLLKVDPEEYAKMQEERKKLAVAVAGGSRSDGCGSSGGGMELQRAGSSSSNGAKQRRK